MKPTTFPSVISTLILALTLMLASTTVYAETDAPLPPRQQFYAQTSEQLAFCSGLSRAQLQQLDKAKVGRQKYAELLALAKDEMGVFAYAADVVADRRSIPGIWKNGDAWEDFKQAAAGKSLQYRQAMLAELVKGNDLRQERNKCSELAQAMRQQLGEPPQPLKMTEAQAKQLGVHLRNVQLVARCAAIVEKAGEANDPAASGLYFQFQRHISFMNTRYMYYLQKLWPDGDRVAYEAYLGQQATPHYAEMSHYWEAVGEETRSELLLDCRKYDRFIESGYKKK